MFLSKFIFGDIKQKRLKVHTELSEHTPRKIEDFNEEENHAILLRQEQCFLILTFGGMLLSNNHVSNTMPKMVLSGTIVLKYQKALKM